METPFSTFIIICRNNARDYNELVVLVVFKLITVQRLYNIMFLQYRGMLNAICVICAILNESGRARKKRRKIKKKSTTVISSAT